jgi:hypothetical protein
VSDDDKKKTSDQDDESPDDESPDAPKAEPTPTPKPKKPEPAAKKSSSEPEPAAKKAEPTPAPFQLTPQRVVLGLGAVGLMLVLWRCVLSKDGGPGNSSTQGSPSSDPSASSSSPVASASVAPPLPPGLSGPIAAANVGGGDVLIAALDAQAKAIVVQRINSKDEVVAKGVALTEVAGSSDSELKLLVENLGPSTTASDTDAGESDEAGAAATATATTKTGDALLVWRGLRGGKLVRQYVVLNGADLKPKGEPAEALAAFCATRDAVWFSDGSKAVSRPWSSSAAPKGDKGDKIDLPKEKDASLLCSQKRAFAVLEEDERTSVLPLGHPPPDAGPHAIGPVTMIRDNDFGEDEQRELSEYTVADDVGFVRLAASGAIAIRELASGSAAPGQLRKLKTQIKKDDDLVAVEASAKSIVIVYTQDVSDTSDAEVCTKVGALRVDRTTFEESLFDLSPGKCGHEVGPFWTSTVADTITIAWPERTSASVGKSRAPIASLAHTQITATNKPTLSRVDQSAEALTDAGCTQEGCFAAALIRPSPTDKGAIKILRYK